MSGLKLVRLIFLVAILVGVVAYAVGREHNGFDLGNSLVPVDEIHLGGPPRDGIPAIDEPRFVAASDASFLAPADRVLGLHLDGVAKAYPIRILNWHEVVNDAFGAQSVAVTYCPLCGTGVAFSAVAAGEPRRFGVSGLLYNSDVLLYDRETESLWSQLLMQAISGPARGTELDQLALVHTSWRAWQDRHPDTLVLSTDTGFTRDYARDPYDGYASERSLYFPVSARSQRYHPKERVLGIEIDGQAKAYPFAELSKNAKQKFDDRIGGQRITIEFDAENESARAVGGDGRLLPTTTGFWFAWYAFHPETDVYTAKN